jgi:hypothetical protein
MPPTAGAYPLTAVGKLPNVSIASPGEVWSNLRANGVVIPGAAIAPVNVGGQLYAKQLIVGDTPVKEQVGVALRQVEVPDVNTGPNALGPNEIVNTAIGAWSNAAILTGTDIFEVFEYRTYGSSNEGILTVRFLRSNQ